MDAMQAEQPATSAQQVTRADSPQQAQRPQLAKDDFFGDDFLPLSISDQYRRPADRRQAEPGGKFSSKRQRVEGQHAEQQTQQRLQAAGLLSDSEGDSSSGDEGGALDEPEVIPFGKDSNRHTLLDHDADGQHSEPPSHLGPTFPVNADTGQDPDDGMQTVGSKHRQQTGSYDFVAAQARRPGLSLSGTADRDDGRRSRGRGRGRETGGRRQESAGRIAAQKPGLPSKQVFNPYAIEVAKSRGVRRSAVMPRSGNKSRTFK